MGWEAQLAKLAAYKRKHGDCSVPNCWAEDPKLGGWVKSQRANKRKLDRGQPSKGMTAERVAKLEALGFRWAKAKETKGVCWNKQRKKWRARGSGSV